MQNLSFYPLGRCDASQKAGIAYMDGAGGVPSVRRSGKGREQERKLERDAFKLPPHPRPLPQGEGALQQVCLL